MKITVVNSDLSPALTDHAQTRAWLATQRFQDRIAWLSIWLRKCNSTQAECRIEAWLRELGPVTAHHRDADPVACVDIASARLKHSIARRLEARWKTPRRRVQAGRRDAGELLLAET